MRIEFSDQASLDLDRIFDHLFTSHVRFGHSSKSAALLARSRVQDIVKQRQRIAIAPDRGQRQIIKGRKIRHLTLNRAIYWFTVDNKQQVIRIEGVFLRGQDHFQRFFDRLGSDGEAG